MDKPKPTKEQVEYEKGLKNLHDLSLKKALSEEGIDTSKVPRMKFDNLRRLLDKQQAIRQKHQETITRAQAEAQTIITKAQADMQAELTEIQKEVEEDINGIRIEQGIVTPAPAEAKEKQASEETVEQGKNE